MESRWHSIQPHLGQASLPLLPVLFVTAGGVCCRYLWLSGLATEREPQWQSPAWPMWSICFKVRCCLKYLGCAYLVFPAYRTWNAAVHMGPPKQFESDRPWRLFLTGLAITIGNPKSMAFYLALLPSLVDQTKVSLVGWADLVGVVIIVNMIVDLSCTAAASRLQLAIRRTSTVRLVNRASAELLAGAVLAIDVDVV